MALCGENPPTFFIDMAEVSYLDSSGLGALIFIHKTWTKQSQVMYLLNLSPMVKKFFTTTGLLGHFQYLDSNDELLKDSMGDSQNPEIEKCV